MDNASKTAIIVPSCILIAATTLLILIIVPVPSKEVLFYEGTVTNFQVGENGASNVTLENGTLIELNSVMNITVGHVYEFFFIVTIYRLGGELATFSRYEEVS
jgi:hypothetical protein